MRGREIGFEPIIEGGFPQEGFISADGNEQMRLRYDFNRSDYCHGPQRQDQIRRSIRTSFGQTTTRCRSPQTAKLAAKKTPSSC